MHNTIYYNIIEHDVICFRTPHNITPHVISSHNITSHNIYHIII